jgi:uncharacterized protein YggU (UPF0235/DUF167 family)
METALTDQMELKNILAKNKEKYFKIKLVPGAPRTAFISALADGTLKIAVTAAPEKNRANQALLVFLAASLGKRPACLKIVSGASSRRKLVKLV